MEVVSPNLTALGVATSIIESGSDAPLDGFDDFFILHLDPVEPSARSTVTLCRVPDVGMERNLGAPNVQRSDHVERESPRVEVEHDVGEQPEVERADALGR